VKIDFHLLMVISSDLIVAIIIQWLAQYHFAAILFGELNERSTWILITGSIYRAVKATFISL
jgi:hypothetical protein